MKKTLALLLVVCMLFGMVPFAASAASSDETTRDIVLLLDNSVSMEGTPLEYLKTAAKKFCTSLFESEGENRLGIVIYDTSIVNVIDFTDDLSALTSAIDNMDGQGSWTNIDAAALKADELLSTSGATIKNIVILTDGLPTYGKSASEGPYDINDTSASGYDYGVYKYANALYADVVAMHPYYNVYTFGFFHNMSEENYAFGQQLLKDLQNAGYYEVTDPEELEFTFGELADDVVSTDDNDPIIIIPGIMGSRLFTSSTVFDDSTRVWDPPKDDAGDIWNIHKLNERMDMGNTLYVRPCENQNDLESGTVATYGREYGAIDTYKNLVDGLCDAYPNRGVYVFSYDWRQSNADNAKKLSEAIKSIGSEKVDLVCHSMGGLVASSYYKSYASEGKIDKIITCGTPYEGAPTLINNVQNWDVLGDGASIFSGDDWADLFLGVWGGMRSDLKASFHGVAELTPTKNYVSKIPMQKDSWAPFGWCDYELTYDEYVKICEEIFSKSNFTNATEFQESLHGSNGYNVLLGYENAYFLIGVNQKTMTAVKFQFANNDIDQKLYESDVSYDTKGDGTVPYLSASIMEQIEKLDQSHWTTKSVDHTDTVKNAECIEWVTGILKDGTSNVTADPVTGGKYTVVRIACPVDVTITVDGETLSSCTDDLAFSSSFGRLDLLGENNEIKMLCVDSADDYSIELNGTGEGTMDYAIRFFDENSNQYDERIFDDIPITEDTVIYTDATEDEEIVMNVDHDGDGEIDETWTAKHSDWITEDDADRIALDSIELKAETQELTVDETTALSVVMNPIDTNDKIEIQYSSSDESVAVVDQDGVVTGIAEGTVTIIATASNGMEATIDITVSSHVHSWDEGIVTKEPTEDTEGERTYTCGTCGDTYTEIIPVLEHTHNYTAVVTDPTCTEQGYTTYTCECSDSYVDDYVDAHGHNVVLMESEPASCELNGYEYYACEYCGGQESNIILEATGHSYVDGECEHCGEADPNAKPSTPCWGSWFDKWFGSWWGDNEEEEEKCEHAYNSVVTDPSCTGKGYTTHTCEKCGDSYKDSYVDATGHNYVDGVCENCGSKKTSDGWFDWIFRWFW